MKGLGEHLRAGLQQAPCWLLSEAQWEEAWTKAHQQTCPWVRPRKAQLQGQAPSKRPSSLLRPQLGSSCLLRKTLPFPHVLVFQCFLFQLGFCSKW